MLRRLTRLFGGARWAEASVVTLNVGHMPFGRGDHFEVPIEAALRHAKLGPIGA